MRRSHPKNKYRFNPLFFGAVLGVLITFAAIVGAYHLFLDWDAKSKVSFMVKKGAERVNDFIGGATKEKQQKIPFGKGPQNAGPIFLKIEAGSLLRAINPLIYGSNLTSKTEFEMDVAHFGQDLGITNFRFPGGGSMGYRWKQGIYEFESRYDQAPLAKIENVITFCEMVGAKLVIQVNVESGTPQEAAEWVQSMNINKLGNYRVDYWELGNEVYGDWDRAYMSGEDYVKVIKRFATAMKAVDPTIKIGANWGGPRYQAFDEAVIKGAATDIDFVSYHWYPNHVNRDHVYNGRTHPLPEEIMANSHAVGAIVDRFHQMVEKHAPRRKGLIEFTVMEWDGSWDAVASDLEFEYRGMTWALANAIFHADALGQFALHGVTVANQYSFQEIMHGLIRGWDKQAGWGGSRWDGQTIRPKALAIQLFAKHFGDVLLRQTLEGSPTYVKEADWRADSYTGNVPYLTSYVAQTSATKALTIVLINKHAEHDYKVNIHIKDAEVAHEGEVWILNGPNLEAQNDGSPGTVTLTRYPLKGFYNKFSYSVPAHSVNLLKIPLLKGDVGGPLFVEPEKIKGSL